MPVQAIRNISDSSGLLDRIASLFFFSSLPLILPCLDALNHMLGTPTDKALLPMMENATFISSMLVATMFTALALLFVCLLKTSFNQLGGTLIRVGGIAYLGGFLVLAVTGWLPETPRILLTAAGLPLGFGAAVICMTWFSRICLRDFRMAFIALLAALLAASAVTIAALLLPAALGISLLFALACLGTFKLVLRPKRLRHERHDLVSPGSNWWDVFGTFDISSIEGTGGFKTPASRILFFVVTPLATLLLFTINRNVTTAFVEPFETTLISCLFVVLCSIPLLFIRSEQGLIHVSYSLYLPLMAFCIFALNSFVSGNLDGAVIGIGIDVFCILYFLLVASMIIAMAGQIRSLVLPAISILLIALSLVGLLSFSKVQAGALAPFQHYVLISLFVLIVAMLLATPGSRIWHMMLAGVSQSVDQAAMTSFLERCDAWSKEFNLTSREAEILVYLGRGHSASYVADVLVIAESTVRSHRKNIYRKLGINSREELLELLNESPEGSHSDTKR